MSNLEAIFLVLALGGLGVGLISVPNHPSYRFARLCFLGATLAFSGQCVMWGLKTDFDPWPRLVLLGIFGAIAMIGATESLSWVGRSQRTATSSANTAPKGPSEGLEGRSGSAPLTTAPSTTPAPPPIKPKHSQAELNDLRDLLSRISDLIENSDTQLAETERQLSEINHMEPKDFGPVLVKVKSDIETIRSNFIKMTKYGNYRLYNQDVTKIGIDIGDDDPFQKLSNVIANTIINVDSLAGLVSGRESMNNLGDGMKVHLRATSMGLAMALMTPAQRQFYEMHKWLGLRRQKWQEVRDSLKSL
jgi:hypothetical protein